MPVREDAAAPRAAQFRGLRGYLATRRPAARLLHSHQHAGGDRAVSAQSSRMGRGARPPYPSRNSRHLLGFFITIVSGERVDLFIRSMKNDTFAQGNRISLAWQTRSGVPLGRMTETYLALLKQDGVQDSSSPFFSPTAASGTFVPVPTGSSSRFNGIVKQLLQHFFPSLSKADLSRFSFHSLRRGGATYARLRGVALGLILRQGLWATLDGARSYIQPSNFEKTLATAEM